MTSTVSAVPDVIDALIALGSDALPDVLVLDGYGVTNDPGDFLMIGVEDPDATDAANSAEVASDWATSGQGGDRDETGTITCAALSWNGNGAEGQKQARDAVYAMAAGLWATIAPDPSLGIPELLWTTFGGTSQLTQAQDDKGALALLVFRIGFRARI